MFRKAPSIVYWLDDNLYLNITNRCSNNCFFCIRNFRNGVGGFNLRLKREPSVTEVISELQKVINRRNWSEVVFCGFGEPMIRLDCLLQVTQWIRKYHGKGLSVRVATNGHEYLLNEGQDAVKEQKNVDINRISVSLNAHDKVTYDRICRPKFTAAFENVLEFVEMAKGDFEVSVTAVAIPDINIPKVREIAERIGVKLRVRECVPGFW